MIFGNKIIMSVPIKFLKIYFYDDGGGEQWKQKLYGDDRCYLSEHLLTITYFIVKIR